MPKNLTTCYVKDVLNYGADSKGNTGNCTLYPFEELVFCGWCGVYAKVKKTGKGNYKQFLVNKKELCFNK